MSYFIRFTGDECKRSEDVLKGCGVGVLSTQFFVQPFSERVCIYLVIHNGYSCSDEWKCSLRWEEVVSILLKRY